MASSSSPYYSPCAACKFLRRKCMPGCPFSPYFPPEDPQKFANVHRIFGSSNVSKLLKELLPHQREDAVNSLAYEAEARLRDPVYGCTGIVSFLQRQVERLQNELDATKADLFRYVYKDTQKGRVVEVRRVESERGEFCQTPDFLASYRPSWNDTMSGKTTGEGGEREI